MNKENKKSLLQDFYEGHHIKGNRLRRSMYEEQRASLFGAWIGTGKKILDLGGRDGTLTRHFSQGNEITIGDIDENALQRASAEYGFATQVVDLNSRLPFDDNHFDVVIMAEVLEHLPYPEITLGEIRRVLKNGGHYIGNIPLAYHWKDRWKVVRGKKLTIASDPTHLQFLTYDDLKKMLGSFFTVERMEVLRGGRKAVLFPKQFARNVAYMCRKTD